MNILNKKNNNLIVPSFKDHNIFFNTNYKLNELKSLCNMFKLKKIGNKKTIKERIYNYLKDSFYASKIQKIWRKYILDKLLKLKGPGLINRSICVNEIDFLTLDNIKDINFFQFISFIDNNLIFGFNIISLYNLFISSNKKTLNPFNRNELPVTLLDHIKKIKLYTKFLFNYDIVINLDKIKYMSKKHELEMYAITIFQDINNNGFYCDSKWLIELNINRLRIFLKELHDIWVYRATLSDETKKNICFPTGKPFSPINFYILSRYNYETLLHITLKIINNIVNLGIDNANKTLGCNLVLCALTLVNNEAAQSLPWLYQSVI